MFNEWNYLCDIDPDRLKVCTEECTFYNGIHCDEDIYYLVHLYMEENDWSMPRDAYEAAEVYISLRN